MSSTLPMYLISRMPTQAALDKFPYICVISSLVTDESNTLASSRHRVLPSRSMGNPIPRWRTSENFCGAPMAACLALGTWNAQLQKENDVLMEMVNF